MPEAWACVLDNVPDVRSQSRYDARRSAASPILRRAFTDMLRIHTVTFWWFRADEKMPRKPCGPSPTIWPIDICGRTCSRAEIMTADQRLRSAYARAERAGVPRPVLAFYRNRWAALRSGASDEPHRLVQGYVRLAVDLNDRARDARARRS